MLPMFCCLIWLLYLLVGILCGLAALYVYFWLTACPIPKSVRYGGRLEKNLEKFEMGLRIINTISLWIELGLGMWWRMLISRWMFTMQHRLQPPLHPWIHVEEDYIAGVPCRVYRPSAERRKSDAVVVWIHGGGWCIVRPPYYDFTIGALMRRLGCIVVCVDFALAPERRFPAPIDECERVIDELYMKGCERLGADPEKIFIIGDSAGGQMCATLCQRFAATTIVKGQTLLYPTTHLLNSQSPSHQLARGPHKGFSFMDRPSYARAWLLFMGMPVNVRNVRLVLRNRHLSRGIREDVVIRDIMGWTMGEDGEAVKSTPEYAGVEEDEELATALEPLLRNPEISPVLAFPPKTHAPTLVVTAGVDVLRDDGIVYAQRLRQCGIECQWRHYEDTVHGMLSTWGFQQNARILDDVVEFYRQHGA